MSKIIVLQGPPCSGKSTYADQYIKFNNNAKIVSLDHYREAREEYWMPKLEDEISAKEVDEVKDYLSKGYDIIIDDMNLNKKTMTKWYSISKEYNAQINIIVFYCTYKEALERDNNSDRKHNVGKKALKRIWRTYYPDRLLEESKETVEHKRIPVDNSLPHAVICDIDGTLAWMNNRSPYDYTSVSTDNSDPRMVQLLNMIMKFGNDVHIIFVSGREGNEQCYNDTYEWLKNNLSDYKYHTLFSTHDKFSLLMRTEKDYRPDDVIKKEIYQKYIQDRYDLICVFDDRNKVVNMWRELGMLCLQVNDGEF